MRHLLIEALKSGTVAAFAMPVAGSLTKPIFGWHVWQYGKRVSQLFVDNPTPSILLVHHMVWAWVAAALLIIFLRKQASSWPVLLGGAVGAIYYFLVNALALPMYFGDPMPWQQGVSYVVQPLIVLVVFGACVAYISRSYLSSQQSED